MSSERAGPTTVTPARSGSGSFSKTVPLVLPTGSFLDHHQQAVFSQLNEYFQLEALRPWRNPEQENARVTEINNSVTLLCDFTDNVLIKYREGAYQHQSSIGRPEANIGVMLAYTLISRVLTIYRSFCQMLIDHRLMLQQQRSPSLDASPTRPSLKKKASSQVQFVAQLAVAEYHLQHLAHFFHAPEFTDCLQPATMESGARCLQDLQRTIHDTVANVRAG
jgi:hypothetical protein